MRNEREDAARHRENKKTQIVQRLSNPTVCGLASLIMLSTGSVILAVAERSFLSIERTVDEAHPYAVSSDELQKAQSEILIFNQNVDNLILTKDLTMNSAFDQQKLQRARDAIRLINQNDIISQQRQELHEKLYKDKSTLRKVGEWIGMGLGSIFFSTGAIGVMFITPYMGIEEDKKKGQS